MALMIPTAIPSEMREKYDIPSSEVKVFEELRRLPDEFTCVWSVPWADPELTKRSGEADFLIIHPRLPLTVVEVKGGQISCNLGKWTRLVRGQLEFAECPINQAHKSREALLRKFTRMNGFPQSQFIPSAIVVVLTDASRASLIGDKGYYSRVMTVEDMPNFKESLEKAMTLPEEKLNRRNEGIGKVAADFIRTFFSMSPSYKVPLRSLIDLDVVELSRISKEHYLTINQLEKERKIIINGRAGTGKTVLAIQKALRDAQLGRKTLLICFNEKLAARLCETIEQNCSSIKKYITCCSYHQLCTDICRKNNEAIDDCVSNLKNHLEELEFRAECLAIHEDSKTEAYQTVVVDEGQDFRENWWRVLASVFYNDSDGFFWIFRDEVQNIQQQSQFPLDGFFEFTLLKNFRNSQSVYNFMDRSTLSKFLGDTIPIGPRGAECRVISIFTQVDLKEKLALELDRLIKKEKIRPDEIVILSGKSLENPSNPLFGISKIGQYKIDQNLKGKGDGILLETIRKYKGLESKYVVLIEIDGRDNSESIDKLIYVGASRAVSGLTVISTQATLERLGWIESQSA